MGSSKQRQPVSQAAAGDAAFAPTSRGSSYGWVVHPVRGRGKVLFLSRKEAAATITIAITETNGNKNPRMEVELAVVDVALEATPELTEVVAVPVEDRLGVDVVLEVVVAGRVVEVLSVLSEVVEVADVAPVPVDVVLELLVVLVVLEVLVVLDEDADVVVTCETERVNVPKLPSLLGSPE